MMNISSEVAKRLLQINAIKLNPQNPFTWASGRKAPIYCDNRVVLSHPGIRHFVIDCLEQKAKEFGSFNMVAGVATAGIAHGILLAERLDQPFVYVRSKAKGHGRKNLIEGALRGDERVLVVEDLISTGGSSLKAVEVLTGEGCEIAGVLAIFTYGLDSAAKAFERAKCHLETLSNYDVLIREAVLADYISEEDLSALEDWRADPQKWSEAL